MRVRTIARGAAAALLLLNWTPLAATSDSPLPPAVPGESWEVTSQMSMEAMPIAMPAQTQRVCTPKDWKEPPGGTRAGDECRTSDFKTSGNKSTWNVQCTGAHAMTGRGEITRASADAYSGFIKFSSADGAMTVQLNGRRLGACRIAQ
jgi:hypothetical protein